GLAPTSTSGAPTGTPPTITRNHPCTIPRGLRWAGVAPLEAARGDTLSPSAAAHSGAGSSLRFGTPTTASGSYETPRHERSPLTRGPTSHLEYLSLVNLPLVQAQGADSRSLPPRHRRR